MSQFVAVIDIYQLQQCKEWAARSLVRLIRVIYAPPSPATTGGAPTAAAALRLTLSANIHHGDRGRAGDRESNQRVIDQLVTNNWPP